MLEVSTLADHFAMMMKFKVHKKFVGGNCIESNGNDQEVAHNLLIVYQRV